MRGRELAFERVGVAVVAEQRRGRARARRRRSRGRASSSRSTMPSTLTATRVWNCTRPSVAAITSRSRNSRTAATSSAAVGRSWVMSPTSVEEVEQIPFHLGDPAAERGELDRAHDAR